MQRTAGRPRGVLRLLALLVGLVTFSACQEEGTVRVRSLTIQGTKTIDAGKLRAALATRVSARLPWGRSVVFDRSRLDADLKRVVAFCSDRGFPDARVTSVDVRPTASQDAVDVTLTIDEGPPITVGEVTYTGFDALPPNRLADLREKVPLEPGRPRDRQVVVLARELALNELREQGYPYATVTTDERDDQAARQAHIDLRADPGPLAHFGAVEIVGNKAVDARTIERQLLFRPGDRYRRSVVQSSQRRLYEMQLFQFVNVETLGAETQDPEVRTRVTLVEGRHQQVHVGVGYGTEEKGRVDSEYHHLNFFGGARTAGVHGRWSSLDRGVRADFSQPYLFSPRQSLGLEGQHWLTFTPAYNSVVTGGKVMTTRRPNPRTSWSVSLTDEWNSSEITEEALNDPSLYNDLIAIGLDPTTQHQEGTLTALAIDLQRSTADSVLNARRGYQLAFHLEQAGQFLPGTFNYYAASAEGRHYRPLSDRLVWANRLQLGNITPVAGDPANVPFGKKYFLGGASSLRGWGRFEVSPLGGEGTPIGGNSLAAFSSELRATLRGGLGGVAFLDGGYVWADLHDLRLSDLRYDIGLGARYDTPVGPIRFDFGYQLNPIPGLLADGKPETRRWRLHFSIGQAF
jgi:outer membrane protein assembly complex protein YaeT